MTRTLMLIFAALALMIGSFIWFVATWDRDAEQPLTLGDNTPVLLAQHACARGDPATCPGHQLMSFA